MLVGVSAAVAGGCPSDQMKANARQPVTHAGKGVTDTVLAAIDLEKEPANIKERQLRFRKLTIEPGGIVPWHSHADRPAIIYIACPEELRITTWRKQYPWSGADGDAGPTFGGAAAHNRDRPDSLSDGRRSVCDLLPSLARL